MFINDNEQLTKVQRSRYGVVSVTELLAWYNTKICVFYGLQNACFLG